MSTAIIPRIVPRFRDIKSALMGHRQVLVAPPLSLLVCTLATPSFHPPHANLSRTSLLKPSSYYLNDLASAAMSPLLLVPRYNITSCCVEDKANFNCAVHLSWWWV